jgi:hypothetical protein
LRYDKTWGSKLTSSKLRCRLGAAAQEPSRLGSIHGAIVVHRASMSIAVLIIVATIGHARADDSVSKKSAEQLIGELGDNDFNRREAATKAIEALGADALPALQKAANHPDAEVRSRIDKLIPLAMVAPKRVSLKLSGMPIHGAIDALLKEAGYKLDFDHTEAPYQKPCDIKLSNVTFWEGLEKRLIRLMRVLFRGFPGFSV